MTKHEIAIDFCDPVAPLMYNNYIEHAKLYYVVLYARVPQKQMLSVTVANLTLNFGIACKPRYDSPNDGIDTHRLSFDRFGWFDEALFEPRDISRLLKSVSDETIRSAFQQLTALLQGGADDAQPMDLQIKHDEEKECFIPWIERETDLFFNIDGIRLGSQGALGKPMRARAMQKKTVGKQRLVIVFDSAEKSTYQRLRDHHQLTLSSFGWFLDSVDSVARINAHLCIPIRALLEDHSREEVIELLGEIALNLIAQYESRIEDGTLKADPPNPKRFLPTTVSEVSLAKRIRGMDIN